MLLLGYDIGSSAIKAAVLDAETGTIQASARAPSDEEMTMEAPRPGWAEQPNNAFSLNVLGPGEVAATAGTSGVIYGVGDAPDYDPQSRVSTFLHVNHEPETPAPLRHAHVRKRHRHPESVAPRRDRRDGGALLSADERGGGRGAGVGAGLYDAPEDAFEELDIVDTITPKPKQADAYAAAYNRWRRILTHQLNAPSDHD